MEYLQRAMPIAAIPIAPLDQISNRIQKLSLLKTYPG